MSSCEKCWADAYNYGEGCQATAYGELLKSRTCTPEQQAGEDATECPECKRMTLHQVTRECMNGCRIAKGE